MQSGEKMIELKALSCPKCGGNLDINLNDKYTICPYCSTFIELSSEGKVTNSFHSPVECQDINLLEIIIQGSAQVADFQKSKLDDLTKKKDKISGQKIPNAAIAELSKKYDVNKMQYQLSRGKLRKKKLNEYLKDKEAAKLYAFEQFKDELSEITQQQIETYEIYSQASTDSGLASWKLETIKYDQFRKTYIASGRSIPENSIKKPILFMGRRSLKRELLKAIERGGETEAIQLFHDLTGFSLSESPQRVAEIISSPDEEPKFTIADGKEPQGFFKI